MSAIPVAVGPELRPRVNSVVVSFKTIAFELGYGSTQIDSVYAALGLLDGGIQEIPVWVLESYKDTLPKKFQDWISHNKDVSILFEYHTIPAKINENDWDLIAFD